MIVDESRLEGVHRWAAFDEQRQYRYELGRLWDPSRPTFTVVMLNPSTADALVDDPTIRRCIGFAKRWLYGAIRVVNLFALRSSNPIALREASDPVGPSNAIALAHAIAEAGTSVYAAWGTFGHPQLPRQASFVQDLAAAASVRLLALQLTANGSPKHPLYISYDVSPQPWEART